MELLPFALGHEARHGLAQFRHHGGLVGHDRSRFSKAPRSTRSPGAVALFSCFSGRTGLYRLAALCQEEVGAASRAEKSPAYRMSRATTGILSGPPFDAAPWNPVLRRFLSVRGIRPTAGGDVFSALAAATPHARRLAAACGFSRRRFAHCAASRNRRRCGGDGKCVSVAAFRAADRRNSVSANRYCVRGLLTVGNIIGSPDEKRRLGERCGAVAVDMETAVAARLCGKASVPFGCLRAISDDVDASLSESLLDLLQAGRVNPPRLLAAVLRRPPLIAELMQLGAHTRKAAWELAVGLETLLGSDIP